MESIQRNTSNKLTGGKKRQCHFKVRVSDDNPTSNMYRSGVLLGRVLGSLHDLPMTSMRSTKRAKGLYSPV